MRGAFTLTTIVQERDCGLLSTISEKPSMKTPQIPYYLDYLPQPLLEALDAKAEPIAAVPGLKVAPGLRQDFESIETDQALAFAVSLYKTMAPDLARVLEQRRVDRVFIDDITQQAVPHNADLPYHSPDYRTAIGAKDANGRIVVGPHPASARTEAQTPVEVPEFLQGEQVTLFGPPDTARMSINAMNAWHRRMPGEPEVVTRLVEASGQVPRWGADNEDSKTPIMHNFLRACRNLMGCFDGTLRFEDTRRGKRYELAQDHLATPIKRIPGLALPDGNHLLDGNPLPLHLVDFALHLFHNHTRPQALVFYVPKLENEEEAAYLNALISEAERLIQAQTPSYKLGTIKLFIVFENPRAIFRIQEIAAALAPHFVGGSLGWHDFLGSTARLFRHDPRYRIPVKADPNIVINHIRQSHHILVDALTPLGAIKIGGMYGVLPEDGNAQSFQVTMVGYIKDVTTQLRRGLDGFWVAHPDFVRLGLALVEAWRLREADPNDGTLRELIEALVTDPDECSALLKFVFEREDVPGLSPTDPLYHRGVLAANIETSDAIANDDPQEARYNVFQALQYLADWLTGNGCVALPAAMESVNGQKVFVRIMDDLATTERSRWELWAEVAHGRVSVENFDQILQQEIAFIKAGLPDDTRRVQVKWEGESARWYPVAVKLLRQLVVEAEPVEFATELLMPFTLSLIRQAEDPWQAATDLCPGRYT